MSKMAKIIICVVLVLAVGIAGFAAYLNPAKFETTTCHQEAASLTFVEQGSYDYVDEYDVLSLVSGEVLDIQVEEGDEINEGDVIAVVDASEYEYQVAQLHDQIAAYEGNMEDLDSQQQQQRDQLLSELESLNGQISKLDVEARQNNDNNYELQKQIEIQRQIVENNERMEDNALAELNRVEETGDQDMITSARSTYHTAQNSTDASRLSLQQLESGLSTNDVYQTQRQSLQSQINRVKSQLNTDYTDGMKKYYESQIQSTQTNIDQMNNKAGQAEIISKVSGVVSSLPISNQNTVNQQSKVAVIASRPQVEVYVPIRDIDGVFVGDKAELLLDKRTGTETVIATVTDIAENAEAKQSALGVEVRKVRVLLTPDTDDLRIGYNMDVRFCVYSEDEAIIIPKTAVFSKDGADYVWLISDGRLVVQSVTKGVETSDGYIISAGLANNDIVIRNADDTELKEGKRVASANE